MVASTSIDFPTSFYRKLRMLNQNDLINDQQHVNCVAPVRAIDTPHLRRRSIDYPDRPSAAP